MNPRMYSAARYVALTAAVLLLAGPVWAFKVIKNVNSGKPLEDKVVLFDKGKPADFLVFSDPANCKLNKDGAIECSITGDKAIRYIIHWKPHGTVEESFDGSKYNYLVLTFRVEGSNKTTDAKGKVTAARAGNLWMGILLTDPKDNWTGSVNPADMTDDGSTPDKTVTLNIPMSLMTNHNGPDIDPHHITGLGFNLGGTHPGTVHDFRIVIDKISLAE